MNYNAPTISESGFYNDKKWIAVRNFVRKRDEMTCRICGSYNENRYEVDHIIELTWENVDDPNIALNPENCQLLCFKCHKEKTRRDKQGKGKLFF